MLIFCKEMLLFAILLASAHGMAHVSSGHHAPSPTPPPTQSHREIVLSRLTTTSPHGDDVLLISKTLAADVWILPGSVIYQNKLGTKVFQSDLCDNVCKYSNRSLCVSVCSCLCECGYRVFYGQCTTGHVCPLACDSDCDTSENCSATTSFELHYQTDAGLKTELSYLLLVLAVVLIQ
jgi:hypothetical protein